MSQFAIRTEAIGKKYRIGAAYRPNLREALISAFSAPKRYASRLLGRPVATVDDGFWAVRDVSLEIRPGELVVPDQLIDRTFRREPTFFDDLAVHVTSCSTRRLDQ